MAYEYDDQLIDATAVRRQRLTAALLYRGDRLRRQWTDRVRTLLISVFVTVLLSAGCVAVSFVTTLLASDPTRSPTTGVGGSPSPASSPTPTQAPPPSTPSDTPPAPQILQIPQMRQVQ